MVSVNLNSQACLSYEKLKELAKGAVDTHSDLPFSVYSSVKEQRLANVPVIRPLLIFILGGTKLLGKEREKCPAGSFVFLSNSPDVDMRNIPSSRNDGYFAVLLEFDYADFSQFRHKPKSTKRYFLGEINKPLSIALAQFIEFSTQVPKGALKFRKQELLNLIYLSGHEEVCGIAEPPSLSHQVYEIINQNIADDWGVERLCTLLCMSESTLRRKLKAEKTSVQDIKNRTKLGFGLHLVQSTIEPIGLIAERCGYQSQSRFTDQFKMLFGMTPSDLRKTRKMD
ncbi:helix-turn-helix transcriptional regulator [Microbulbifer harenosus]|uniref:helix-turn-helix transcriptional regulator n=1 Tax=Microbulbifer harenosus TaxID=2576840 RepID=UPI001C709B0F|nr:AraC family transcriptional regulator [Microbulbifer harenosus]